MSKILKGLGKVFKPIIKSAIITHQPWKFKKQIDNLKTQVPVVKKIGGAVIDSIKITHQPWRIKANIKSAIHMAPYVAAAAAIYFTAGGASGFVGGILGTATSAAAGASLTGAAAAGFGSLAASAIGSGTLATVIGGAAAGAGLSSAVAIAQGKNPGKAFITGALTGGLAAGAGAALSGASGAASGAGSAASAAGNVAKAAGGFSTAGLDTVISTATQMAPSLSPTIGAAAGLAAGAAAGGSNPSSTRGLLTGNSTTGQLIAGAGQGLMQGMAAKDKAKGDLKLQQQQQDYYKANYGTGTRGLLTGDEDWVQSQPWNQATSVTAADPEPTITPISIGPRYVFDPKLGRIVQDAAPATS